jgi:two-component system sensor histidine kinase YesM
VGTEVDHLKWIMNPIDENNQLLTDKIGLYNVHQRIRLFYGDQYGIEVQSKPGFWFKVIVVIPLQGQEQGQGKGSDT